MQGSLRPRPIIRGTLCDQAFEKEGVNRSGSGLATEMVSCLDSRLFSLQA